MTAVCGQPLTAERLGSFLQYYFILFSIHGLTRFLQIILDAKTKSWSYIPNDLPGCVFRAQGRKSLKKDEIFTSVWRAGGDSSSSEFALSIYKQA